MSVYNRSCTFLGNSTAKLAPHISTEEHGTLWSSVDIICMAWGILDVKTTAASDDLLWQLTTTVMVTVKCNNQMQKLSKIGPGLGAPKLIIQALILSMIIWNISLGIFFGLSTCLVAQSQIFLIDGRPPSHQFTQPTKWTNQKKLSISQKIKPQNILELEWWNKIWYLRSHNLNVYTLIVSFGVIKVRNQSLR